MASKKGPGVWLSYFNDDGVPIYVAAHGSELAALRRAVDVGGSTQWVSHDQTLDDAINGVAAGADRLPGEQLPELPADPVKKPAAKRATKKAAAAPADESKTPDA